MCDPSKHLLALRRFAWKLTRDREQSRDLVQDTCERALTFAHTFDPSRDELRWLRQVMFSCWRRSVTYDRPLKRAAIEIPLNEIKLEIGGLRIAPVQELRVELGEALQFIDSMGVMAKAALISEIEGFTTTASHRTHLSQARRVIRERFGMEPMVNSKMRRTRQLAG